MTLVPGQNCPLPEGPISLSITAGAPADFSAFRLYGDGKTGADEDFIFYGQTSCANGSVTLSQEGQRAKFEVDPSLLPVNVQKVAFAITSDFSSIAALNPIRLVIAQNSKTIASCDIDTIGRNEAALILGEIYKRDSHWKFRFISQGFTGGLKPLAEMYGVEIAEDEPQPSKVNLSKVVLTKSNPRIDLAKKEIKGGTYKINLNWHRGQKRGLGGLFGLGSKGIDLDLGAYVRDKNGRQTIIQALGGNFGNLMHFPYVQLMGDDRTGDQSDGEWLFINGDHIDELEEIIVYAFIYEGAPNWSATDGVVRLQIANQPEIETALTGTDNSLPMCAIARMVNNKGHLAVERLDRYFSGHPSMDHAFGWGFNWTKGRK